jgi:hypothetical protein
MIGTQQVQESNDMQGIISRKSCSKMVSRNAPILDYVKVVGDDYPIKLN